MSNRVAAHEMTDVAALYALGALSQHEARSFEAHLAEGCDICQAELESFEQTASAVALSAAANSAVSSERVKVRSPSGASNTSISRRG